MRPLVLFANGTPPDVTSESIRPVGIRHKKAQDRTAHEEASRADLRGDRDFAEPASLEAAAPGHAIETGIESERKVLGEEDLRPGAEGVPLRRAVLRVPVAGPLIDEKGHNSERLIRLDQKIFLHQQCLPVLKECSGVFQCRAEITRHALPILDRKGVEASVEFRARVADPEIRAIRRGNYRAIRLRTALGIGIVVPESEPPLGYFHAVEPHIDVTLGVIAEVRNDVRPCTPQKATASFPNFKLKS